MLFIYIRVDGVDRSPQFGQPRGQFGAKFPDATECFSNIVGKRIQVDLDFMKPGIEAFFDTVFLGLDDAFAVNPVGMNERPVERGHTFRRRSRESRPIGEDTFRLAKSFTKGSPDQPIDFKLAEIVFFKDFESLAITEIVSEE